MFLKNKEGFENSTIQTSFTVAIDKDAYRERINGLDVSSRKSESGPLIFDHQLST